MFGKKIDWSRWSIANAVVTFGLSQIFFNLITANLDFFTGDKVFFLWILLWALATPFVVVLVLDIAFSRAGPDRWGYRIWRSLLYTLLAVSLFRQFHFLNPETFSRYFGFFSPVFSYGIVTVLVFALSMRSQRILPLYVSYLGVVALILTALFIQRTGLLSQVKEQPARAASRVQPVDARAPIFLIVFDELSYDALIRDGKIDTASYPNFAALASGGIWFTNATTNHWMTEEAVASLLTGLVRPSQDALTIFEQFPAGYRINMIETEMGVERWYRSSKKRNGVTSFQGKAYLLSRDPLFTARYMMELLLYSDFFSTTADSRVLVNVPAFHTTFFREADLFLRTVSPNEVTFWHMSIPHSPFFFSADGTRHRREDIHFPEAGEYDPSRYDAIMANYLEQVKFADRVLGRFLDLLKRKGLYDRSVILVTSDHGVRVWGNLYRYIDLIARVPVILRAPHLQSGMLDVDFQLIDVVPTLLDVLGYSYSPSDYDGISAFATDRRQRQKIMSFYLQKVVFDDQIKSWKSLPRSKNGERGEAMQIAQMDIIAAGPVHQLQRGFSAVQALDDLYAARDAHQDFLTLYLANHFPLAMSESDLQSLRTATEALAQAPKTPSYNFKRGMNYFFLALSETQRVAAGFPEDPVQVNAHWRSALENLRASGDLQPWMAEEVTKILQQADTDGDGFLDHTELIALIQNRRPGKRPE